MSETNLQLLSVRVKNESFHAESVMPVDIYVRNNDAGREDSPEFKVNVYASTNSIISIHDELLASETLSLKSGESRSLRINVTVPESLSPGGYYIGGILFADDNTNHLINLVNPRKVSILGVAPPVDPEAPVVNEEDLTPEEIEFNKLVAVVQYLEELLQADALPWDMYQALEDGRALVAAGVSLPEPEAPVVNDEWDDLGFSPMDANGCMSYKPLYDLALDWSTSDDRVERYAATFINQNKYMLALPNRPDQDEAWRENYLKAYQAASSRTIGQFGFNHGKVYARYVKPLFRLWKGYDPIENCYIPWIPRQLGVDTEAKVLEIWTEHQNSRKAKAKFYSVARAALKKQDANPSLRWSGWSPAPADEGTSNESNPYVSITREEED